MRKLLIFFFAALFLWGLASLVSAKPDRTFRLPKAAQKISDETYYLGKTASGVEGYAFLRYAKGFARPRGGTARVPKCYSFLSSGARWRSTEPYVGVPTDPLISSPVTEGSMGTWESPAAFNIFGTLDTSQLVDGADTIKPDGKNELYFGPISEPGVIGVTIVWGYFSGPLQTRRLVEWDTVLDNVDFRWGDATTDPTVMDYQNILTHELGHAAGMADLYTTSCTEETMYGYASIGEVKKRDLNTGDTRGIKELYK